MRILITGANGMLGRHLGERLSHHEVTLASRAMLDITNKKSVAEAVGSHDVIVNAAAYTNVDKAESEEELANEVNAVAVDHLARACADAHARLVHVSTDYVFDGASTTPYQESSSPAPNTAYGRTKAAGEAAVLNVYPENSVIVRTAWLYGKYGSNFAATMLRLAQSKDSIGVVDDQIGQPSWTSDVARQIAIIIDDNVAPGVLHGTNAGQASWYDFARAVFEASGLDANRIRPISTDEMPRPAARPAYSVLGHKRWQELGLPAPRDWREALHDAVHDGLAPPLR